MSSVDPLKSAISIGNVDDTSLALPSGNQYRSGQRRVLEQVQSIRRSKSRHCSSRSGSTSLSPTSPSHDSVFTDGVKSLSSTSNGSIYFHNDYSKNHTLNKDINRQMVHNSRGISVKKTTSTSVDHAARNYVPVSSVGLINSSRSEPDLAWRRSAANQSMSQQKILSAKNAYVTKRSTSQFLTSTGSQPPPIYPANGHKTKKEFAYGQSDMRKANSRPSITEEAKSKTKGSSGTNGHGGFVDLTLKEAVEFLSSDDQNYQLCGATYIQHSTFTQEKAKEEVRQLNGIPLLLALLQTTNQKVLITASAALRNLSFKNDANKEEIQRCDGIPVAVGLLRDSCSVELHKQLTGLLWNLSSADNLRPDLLKTALPVFVDRVIVPHSSPNQTNGTSIDSDVFFHTTGCLRNLSSARQSSRQTMRKYPGLVDSLVTYIKDCVEAKKPDDESVENCVCILHNLTFQLEAEAPTLFSRITALAKTVSRSSSQSSNNSVGCFSPQSKSTEHEKYFDFPVIEDPRPTGAGWLIHSKTLQSYLSLLSSSQRNETQEACCGTLQNLTVHDSVGSSAISQIIVQKLNGLKEISPFLSSNKINLQRSAMALVKNLMKNPNLHSAIGRKALPELLSLLSKGTEGGNESDDTFAMACQVTSGLILREPEMSKLLLNSKVIKSLNDLSQNIYFPKSSKAASLLLYKIWSDKDLQSYLKKQGMSKSLFVNDITMAAHRSAQIID